MPQKKIKQNQTDGLIQGPASSTDNAIARYDGTTGKLVQNSAAEIGDTGQIYTPQGLYAENTVQSDVSIDSPQVQSDTIRGYINSSPTFTNGLKTDTISEKTAAAGVTIDGTKIKDGVLYDTNANKVVSISPSTAGRSSYLLAYASNGSAAIGAWSDTLTNVDLHLDVKGTGVVRAYDQTGVYYPVATTIGTQTLTNKRITSRRLSSSPAAAGTVAIDSNSYDLVDITPTGNFTIATPTGTPTEGQKLLIRIRDNGTARTITWAVGTWRALGVTLPTTTVANKTMYIGAVYNGNGVWWDVIATAQEA